MALIGDFLRVFFVHGRVISDSWGVDGVLVFRPLPVGAPSTCRS